jgi:PBP1b-binding outer membrane lipoprotein LpoB
MRRTALHIAALAALLMAGCSQKPEPKRELSERQRDSLIGASGIVGSGVVQRALATSDSMAARAGRQDDASRTGEEAPPETPK